MIQPGLKNTKLIQLAALLLVGVLLVHIVMQARNILIPIAWALFIALLILPATKWLERRKLPRWLAIITVLIFVTAVLSVVLYALSMQVAGLLADTPAITNKLEVWIANFQLFLENRFGVTHEFVTQQLSSSLSGMINAGLQQLSNSLVSVFNTLTLLSVIPLYIFFLLYYRDLFYHGLLRIFKNSEYRASSIINQMSKVVQQYLNGLVLVMLVVGVLFYAVLTLLGIKFAFFFAVLLAIFNLIPYIGVILSSFIVVLYALVTTDMLFYPLSVLISLWLIQLLENNLITPFVVGSQVKINPMAALIAIFAGASIWGVSGMILFIPLVGALKVVSAQISSLEPLAILLGTSREFKGDGS